MSKPHTHEKYLSQVGSRVRITSNNQMSKWSKDFQTIVRGSRFEKFMSNVSDIRVALNADPKLVTALVEAGR